MTEYRPGRMLLDVMRTTLVIADDVMRDLKARAEREGRTVSELVETALRRFLGERLERRDQPPLPVMNARELVDLSSRDALCGAME